MLNQSDIYNIFFKPGEVTEIRAYGLRGQSKYWDGWAAGNGVVYGYFNNAEAFGEAAGALEKKKSPGIYFTLNPTVPALLARATNRLKASGPKPMQTTDKDIACIRWLPIDIDPRRPAGISSTNEELQLAIKTRNKIGVWIKKHMTAVKATGYAIPAVSGNGAHLMIRLEDMPNTEQNKDRIKLALHGLSHKFGTDQVDIDRSVFNPARIWKLYGTTARKGDHSELYPHRLSYVEPKWVEVKKKKGKQK